jgi:hypothetical protein
MIIRNEPDGAVAFILSQDEAKRVIIDHGENEICLPVADTLEAQFTIGAALRGELHGDGTSIQELPD